MNTIQNYGMANYQVGFQSRGKKKVAKAFANAMQETKECNTLEKKITKNI